MTEMLNWLLNTWQSLYNWVGTQPFFIQVALGIGGFFLCIATIMLALILLTFFFELVTTGKIEGLIVNRSKRQ